AEISNLAVVIAYGLILYAMIGFSSYLATSSHSRSVARLAAQDRRVEARTLQSASVSADGGSASSGVSEGGSGPGAADAADPAPAAGSMSAQRFALLLAGAATVLHVAGVATRALATQRVPWANMYEFATTSTAVVMLAFLVFSIKRTELRALGTFVIGPVLLVLLLAQTFWIVPAAELTPRLQNSHWLYIHISV